MDRSKGKIASLQVHADLLISGFLPNEAKCVWEPTQIITWFGTVLDTSTSENAATEKRINSLQQYMSSLLATSSLHLPVRKLASVYGKLFLSATALAMSPGLCLGIFSLSSTPRRLGLLPYIFLQRPWLSSISIILMTSLNAIPLWPVKSGAPNDGFPSDPLKRYFRLSGVPLKLCRFILGCAIIFLSVWSF